MTIDALHGPIERPHEAAGVSVAAGAHDAGIFLCPRCTRPLAVGVSKCAGCRTRLVAGVPLVKVGGFVGLGLVTGLLVGGGAVGAVTLIGRPVAAPIAVPPAVVTPSTIPASLAPAPSAAPVVPVVPPAAMSALRQSTAVNQRLLADADLLSRAMAASSESAAEIAPLLRNLASTAAFGDRIATAVGTWDDATAVSRELAAFYGSIDRIADEGLSASIHNERAYRDAGRRMLAILAGLTELDAASRALAGSVGVELPPLSGATD
jgi:hypothetical protein